MRSFKFSHNQKNRFIIPSKYPTAYMDECILILQDFCKNEGYFVELMDNGGDTNLNWVEYEYTKDKIIKTIKITVSLEYYPNYEIKIKWNNEQIMFDKYVEKIGKLIKTNEDIDAFDNALLHYINN